ncbi:hypothetical protein HK098_005733 [Nowakowskiella sp. JEL0407]|nr:hypothetical protein HK098_005733 [Nowakowskiella sp. JEL0407]
MRNIKLSTSLYLAVSTLFISNVLAQPSADCTTLNTLWQASKGTLAPWTLGDTCCNYNDAGVAVVCNAAGAVTSFTATAQGLTGALDPFGTLTALTVLNVAGNAFTGPIPASVLQIAGLVTLDVSGNQLSGPLPAVTRATPITTCAFTGNPATLCGVLTGICAAGTLLPCGGTTLAGLTTLGLTTTGVLTTITIPATNTNTASPTTISIFVVTESPSPAVASPQAVSTSATDSGNMTPIIVGSSIGGAFVLAVLICGIIFQYSRKKENSKGLVALGSTATWQRLRPQSHDGPGDDASERMLGEESEFQLDPLERHDTFMSSRVYVASGSNSSFGNVAQTTPPQHLSFSSDSTIVKSLPRPPEDGSAVGSNASQVVVSDVSTSLDGSNRPNA